MRATPKTPDARYRAARQHVRLARSSKSYRAGSTLALLAFVACNRGASGTDAASDAPIDVAVADAAVDASDAGDAAPAPKTADDPFGKIRRAAKHGCKAIAGGKHVSEADLSSSFVDGDDLLALVNRSPQGQLSPDYAPTDLVEIGSGRATPAADCDKTQCLRKEAHAALGELLAEMKKQGFPGKVESAYRGYATQCGTFLKWASKGTFCEATEQSALPGHSQHQLGTTVDLFTEEWAKDSRGVFREGFGCTTAGKFLQEHAWDHGFVMPYPIHPDDRHPKQKCTNRWDIPVHINPKTGYRFEHWHIRYVGKEAAKRFQKAFQASGPGTPNEITVEQWLRAEKGITGSDVELPVCDGCNCGECATLAAKGEGTCDRKHSGAVHLDEHGGPIVGEGAPKIVGLHRGAKRVHASAKRTEGSAHAAPQIVLEVKLEVPEGLYTQPPIGGFDAFEGYGSTSTYQKLAPYPDTEPRAYPPLPHAWMVAVEPIPNDADTPWPWRVGIAVSSHGEIYDRANVLLPIRSGAFTLRMSVPSGAKKVKVVLLEGGVPKTEPQTIDME